MKSYVRTLIERICVEKLAPMPTAGKSQCILAAISGMPFNNTLSSSTACASAPFASPLTAPFSIGLFGNAPSDASGIGFVASLASRGDVSVAFDLPLIDIFWPRVSR